MIAVSLSFGFERGREIGHVLLRGLFPQFFHLGEFGPQPFDLGSFIRPSNRGTGVGGSPINSSTIICPSPAVQSRHRCRGGDSNGEKADVEAEAPAASVVGP